MTDKPSPGGYAASVPTLFRPSLLWLLIFAPVAAYLGNIGNVSASLVFFCAAIAIVPFAKLIVQGTEEAFSTQRSAISRN